MKIKNKTKEIPLYEIVFTILIVVLCLIFSYINLFRYKQGLNADIAAEGLLAREIWETKQWIPNTWYTSTETKIISTANWSALFYGLTESMCQAMGWGCIIGMLFLLVCIGYFTKELQFNRGQKILFLLLCLLLPNSLVEIQMIYTHAGYYVVYLALFFLTLGWYVRIQSNDKKKWVVGALVYILHFLVGAQGVRGILMISGPLIGLEMIRRVYLFYRDKKIDRQENRITISVLLTLVVGYIGCQLPFSIGQSLSRNIRNAPTKFIEQIVPHFMDAMVWKQLSVIEKVSVAVCLLIVMGSVIATVRKGLKKEIVECKEWCLLVCVLSVVLTAMALTFTTVESSSRYYILIFFAVAMALTILWEKKTQYKWLTIIIIVITFVGNFIRVYIPAMEKENSSISTVVQVAEYLEQEGYEYGYTTFDSANHMTVAVDGAVQVAAVNSMYTMEITKWLTSVNWYVPNAPYEKKTAYIVTDVRLEEFGEFVKQQEDEIMLEKQIGEYTIYSSNYNYSKLTE